MMERTKNPIFPRLFSFPLEYDALWLQAVEDRYYIYFFAPILYIVNTIEHRPIEMLCLNLVESNFEKYIKKEGNYLEFELISRL